jgi:hypothetical protein
MSTDTWNHFCFRIYTDLEKAERKLVTARNKYQRALSHLAYFRRIASLMESVGGPIEIADHLGLDRHACSASPEPGLIAE